MKNPKNSKLIFAGRLTHEKGFDLIMNFCNTIKGSPLEKVVTIEIFGAGPLEYLIPKESFITYHGQVPKEIVLKTRKECDYSLMPSRFLETFGLSAVDSLSLGVPVIGFKKGGLLQFGEGIIDAIDDESFNQTVIAVIENHLTADRDSLSKKCNDIAGQYTWVAWKERFEDILGRTLEESELLLVSDYSGAIGGIESYIHQVVHKIKEWHARSILFIAGAGNPSGALRYLLLPLSAYNGIVKNKIKNERSTKKDSKNLVIRRHSIQRIIGWYPVSRVGKNLGGTKLLMTHDFGIYHPFPSQVYSEEQLLNSMKFSEWMDAGFESFGQERVKKIVRFLPLVFKFLSSKVLIKTIEKNIDIVLVPSPYMKKHLQKMFSDEKRIEVLPHAI